MNPSHITLAELAVTRPGAIHVFRHHGLDFCCHGRRSLAEACAEKGIDPHAISSEIDAAEPQLHRGTDWAARPLGEVLDFIESRYHAALRSDLPMLIDLARKVERVHADKASCPRGLSTHLTRMQEAIDEHLAKEEQVLFPIVRAGRGRMAACPVQVMEREHEDHGRSLELLRSLTGDFQLPAEACGSWRALYAGLERLTSDLIEHIHLENNVVFPRALCE
ncbi:MAG: iron-sulfur cluster repair protein YtfE [bacterium]